MNCRSVFTKELEVLDDKFFTEDRFKEWYNLLLEFSGKVINELRKETGNIQGVAFEINTVLLKEVVYDAIIDLKKVVDSRNNAVNEPNPFKIASCLGYWFLRHKPVLFRAEYDIDLNELTFPADLDETEKMSIVIRMKHMNEYIAAIFLMRYILVIDSPRPICTQRRFNKVMKDKGSCFDGFEDMLNTIYNKLVYYLMYREISPKVIEHFLEAYTLHPYLPYTCDLWSTEGDCCE